MEALVGVVVLCNDFANYNFLTSRLLERWCNYISFLVFESNLILGWGGKLQTVRKKGTKERADWGHLLTWKWNINKGCHLITRLGCKEGSGRCVYNCSFYLVCFSQTRLKQELNQTSEEFLKKKKDLLKNEAEGSFYRVDEALDSSGDCWNHGGWNAFTTGEFLFSRK